jgi:hypothetical protein
MFYKYTLLILTALISNIDHSDCYNIPLFLGQNEKTKVSVHLERFNEKYNLLHIGISFSRNNKELRYDFRPHCENTGYLTTNMDRQDIRNIFPEIDHTNEFINQYKRYSDAIIFDTEHIYSKDILWGFTNYSFDEIIEFEKTLHDKYRIGIYDCRHYVSRFTKWCLDKPTPVWTLHRIWRRN